MFTPKEEHKQEMLNAILAPNESYKAKAYAVVEKFRNWILIFVVLMVIVVILTIIDLYSPIVIGAISGAVAVMNLKYAYVGITQNHLNVAYMGSFNVQKSAGHDIYNLDLIENLKIKSSINQKVITFKYQNKKVKMRISNKIMSKHLAHQEVDGIITALENSVKSL